MHAMTTKSETFLANSARFTLRLYPDTGSTIVALLQRFVTLLAHFRTTLLGSSALRTPKRETPGEPTQRFSLRRAAATSLRRWILVQGGTTTTHSVALARLTHASRTRFLDGAANATRMKSSSLLLCVLLNKQKKQLVRV